MSSEATNESSLAPALGDSWAHVCNVQLLLRWHRGTRLASLYKGGPSGSAAYAARAEPPAICIFTISLPNLGAVSSSAPRSPRNLGATSAQPRRNLGSISAGAARRRPPAAARSGGAATRGHRVT